VPRRPFGSVLRRSSRAPGGSLLPRFYVRWRDAAGHPHLRAAGTTRASAEALLDALRGEVRLARGQGQGNQSPSDAGRRKEAASLPLATLAPEVLDVWSSTLAPGSLRDRRGALARWALRLGPRSLSDVTRADVEEAVRKMREGAPGKKGLAASTVRTEVGILSSALETLRRALRVPLPKLVLYTLRHAYASALLLEHAPPSVVRDLLGHANIKTTDIYLRSLPGDAARAAVNALERARAAPGAPVVATGRGPHDEAHGDGLAAPGPA